MRAVKSVSIDSERRVIITFLDGSTETLYPNCIWCDSEALKEIIKDLLEEKADAVTQTIENVTIATFADGADEALIRKLLVDIEPIQEGTGDPSPENIRPITGRTGLSVVRCGKNLLHITEIEQIPSARGIKCTLNDDGSVHVEGTYALSNNTVVTLGHIALMPGTYTLNGNNADLSNTGYRLQVMKRTTSEVIGYDLGNGLTFTVTEKTDYIVRIHINASLAYNNPINADMYPMISLDGGEYEPYKGSTYSVNWETEVGTVYGGVMDVISGKLTVDRGYIASYNGEVLPSTWISDRDIYSEGTVPTTGSQVVYELAEPIEYQLDAQEITTLLGTNNIWADSGNVLELEYVADTKLYIGESQSGTLGSGRQTITRPEIHPISDKTVEDLTEAVKYETEEKETQEETDDERGE